MNAAAIPSRGAEGAIASCTSDNITRITTCAINDDGAEKKKMAVLKCGTMVRRPADGKQKYTKQDIKDLGASIKWFFGKGPRPEYGRWTYWEKFDYFAVFWGVAIIGSTGLILWFP